ncbi:MAG: WXG100 family type VII secretion target [Lachnospiraceae bacterium]|nr:WXG100 family type VII secretion target [Lachnospiraceae bacterium]
MSTRSEIRFNFRQALAQADELDGVAERLERLSGKTMESSMQTLASAWKGQNATAFLRKEDILKGDVKKTAMEIHDIADDIRRIARRIYNAEMAALQIASRRES